MIPVNDRGEIMLEAYQKLLGPRTKARRADACVEQPGHDLAGGRDDADGEALRRRVLIDGAHTWPISRSTCSTRRDFFVFSGHKIFGPTGIGAVFVREELLDVLPPWQGGGNMIRNVTFEETSYADSPAGSRPARRTSPTPSA